MRRIASPDCVLVIALLVTLLSSLGPIASGVAQAAQNPEPVGQPGGATDAVASSAPGAVRVTRVSVATSGQQGNAESGTFWAVVSDNGRYVAFSSLASNLVADDTNGVYDAFLSDTLLGTTERVTLAYDGAQARGHSGVNSLALSPDARYVAFQSFDTDLGSPPCATEHGVYVRDTQADTTECVFPDGVGAGGGLSNVDISADGRFVVWNGCYDEVCPYYGMTDFCHLFVRDRHTGHTELIDVSVQGGPVNEYGVWARISGDGRSVVFLSDATDLVDVPGAGNLYLRQWTEDRTSAVTRRLVTATVDEPDIATGGRYVVFESSAADLVPGDTNSAPDVFVLDLTTGDLRRASLASGGVELPGGGNNASISADGRYVAFTSAGNVWVHDRVTLQTHLVSVARDGGPANSASWGCRITSISADGMRVAFCSAASNLVADDTNGVNDVFLAEISPLHQVTGRVLDGSGFPIAGVTISASGGYSTTADADGRYTLSGLPAGEYALRAAKTSFAFTPETLNVTLDRDRVNQNFRGHAIAWAVPLAEPFLEFPVHYGSDMTFSRALMDTYEDGLINCWFDHDKPTYQADANKRVTLDNGLDYSKVRGKHVWGGLYCYDSRCYDGHDGLDIVPPDPKNVSNPPVYAAAAGRVVRVCVGSTCDALGNQVWIDHGNNYATVYGHLNSVDVRVGQDVNSGQQLGIMGNTGNSTGVHLHFGVYFNRNLRDPWITDSTPALREELVDPLGWKGRELANPKDDPWETPSLYLWRESREDNRTMGTSGGTLSTPGGLVTVQLPPGALTRETLLSLGEAPAYEPWAQLRSLGISFWFRPILEALALSGQATEVTMLAQQDSLSLPATIVADYESASLRHLDENSLALYHWDDASGAWVPLAGTVDAEARQLSVQTSDLGFFDLQARLLCPAETQEPDDSYYSAQELALGEPVSRLFDIPDDEDWFSLLAEAGKDYVIETRDLAAGVDTVLEVYDLGGVSLLASDGARGGPGDARLVWHAPADGTYFVRVLPAEGSAIGCHASYSLGVTAAPTDGGGARLHLPLVLRDR